ncbi:hypothetical protein ACFP1Z_30765 [Streptomyces gamaensis]|uniref:LPXTG cell wall anchor domain-containing protein n=1 Tax=Streptomyces gamaensis TaxID=1763542 RepID=A0ABW0ZE03_9ACTN
MTSTIRRTFLRTRRVLAATTAGTAALLTLGTAQQPAHAAPPGDTGTPVLAIEPGRGVDLRAPVDNLLPGDRVVRYFDLTNRSDHPVTADGSLTTDGPLAGPGGLRLTVEACDGSWNAKGGCTGPVSTVGKQAAPGSDTGLGPLTVGGRASAHLRYTAMLPKDAPPSLQGTSAHAKLHFTGVASGGSGSGADGADGSATADGSKPSDRSEGSSPSGSLPHTGATGIGISIALTGILLALGLAARRKAAALVRRRETASPEHADGADGRF